MTTVNIAETAEPVFGVTRHGKYTSPKAVLIGRHESHLQGKSAGYTFYEQGSVGRDKPHALILSRPGYRLQAIDPNFQNLYGLTRFGKVGIISAVIPTRPKIKEVYDPGPGAYEVDGCDECRIGISMKGRWNDGESDDDESPGPKYLLPSYMGTGPAFSLSPKYPDEKFKSCSPGPIYLLPTDKKTTTSLTFKPFSLTSLDTHSGPANSNITEAAKRTYRAPPATKFAKAFCSECDWPTEKDPSVGPGPAAFNLRDCVSTGPNPPVAVLTSRPKFKPETSGAGNFVDLFGLTRFGPAGNPGAVLRSRHLPKDKSQVLCPCRVTDEPENDGEFRSKKIGIKIKSRLAGLELNNVDVPGPGAYNLDSFIGKGPAFSLTPKSRGPLDRPALGNTVIRSDLSECQPKPKEPQDACGKKTLLDTSKTGTSGRPPITRTPSNNIFDIISYLEQLCTNY